MYFYKSISYVGIKMSCTLEYKNNLSIDGTSFFLKTNRKEVKWVSF